MAIRSAINRGSEIRTKGKSMGRDRSGAPLRLSSRSVSMRAALFMTGRIALMLAGIAVMALGIDVVVKADLGNSPISATPNVLSIGFTAVSFGTFMLGWQCFLVLVQVAILRREFRLVDLWQIPISVFFGVCIDGFMALIGQAGPASYTASWLWLVVGMAVLALGIVMTVVSGTVMNCGEAVVQAVVRKTGIRFGTGKVLFDLACAALACLCAFLFVGHFAGVREGTLVCAAFTGVIVNAYMGLYGKLREGVRRRRASFAGCPQDGYNETV
ncbi:YczE/YyaS/YitT family protein [Adlercreutzia shanghongiae]|uniref:DUF6198 family protein n=1 Tax=Adlercreutzia shanghongiae TaxID=3111773 RepID=A0ABU6J202_9ACTN|nr:DUF6198 family protein [Adlercreutzia sp. R22]MEC4295978.1 DUF6198 family protein [Adlercreutzia sp. R22]